MDNLWQGREAFRQHLEPMHIFRLGHNPASERMPIYLCLSCLHLQAPLPETGGTLGWDCPVEWFPIAPAGRVRLQQGMLN